jgi:hypothetical protein
MIKNITIILLRVTIYAISTQADADSSNNAKNNYKHHAVDDNHGIFLPMAEQKNTYGRAPHTGVSCQIDLESHPGWRKRADCSILRPIGLAHSIYQYRLS